MPSWRKQIANHQTSPLEGMGAPGAFDDPSSQGELVFDSVTTHGRDATGDVAIAVLRVANRHVEKVLDNDVWGNLDDVQA